MSESNQILVRYVPESTYGTTPVDDAGWKLIPINSETISASPIVVESTRIRTDRMVQDQVKVNEENGGTCEMDISYSELEDLIEAAMATAYSTDVLTLGTTDLSFSLEKEFSDLTPNYLHIEGARIGQLDLNFRFGEIVTGSVVFAGSTSSQDTTSAVGSGSTAALSSDAVMAANVDMDTVTYDGVSIATSGIEIEEITLSINNNLRPNNNIISASPTNQRKGTARLTGRIRAYVSVAAWDLYVKMLTNASTSLVWTITDPAGKGYTFNLPKIKLSGDAPGAGGQDQDSMIEANFLAIETLPTITRIP